MATCSSCGAEILWVKTHATGKAMPLSVKSHEKRFILFLREGQEPSAQLVETCLSHFADCVDAAKHRKPK